MRRATYPLRTCTRIRRFVGFSGKALRKVLQTALTQYDQVREAARGE